MNPAFPANYWAYLNTPSDDAYGEVVDASATTVEGAVAYGEPYYDYLYGQGFDPRLAGNLGGPWGGKSVTPKGYQYSGMPRSAGAQSFLTSTNSQPSSVPHSLPSTLSDLSSGEARSASSLAMPLTELPLDHPQALSAAPNSTAESDPPGILWDAPARPMSAHISVSPGTSLQELVQEYPIPLDIQTMSVAQMVGGDAQMAAAMAQVTAESATKGHMTYAEVAKLPPKARPGYKENKREQEKPVRIVKTGDPLDIRAKDKERRLVAETTAAEAKGAARRAQKALNPLYGTRN